MQAASPDTPPVDVIASQAGLLAHGSRLTIRLPGARTPVTQMDRSSPLTVAGAAPAFHRLPVLAPPRGTPRTKNLRRRHDWHCGAARSS